MAELGTFYAVGVGPGDPELLTRKAEAVIRRCPVIAAPKNARGGTLALDIVRKGLDLTGKEILTVCFAMQRDEEARRAAYAAALSQIKPRLEAGEDVAFLTLGDVAVYSTAAYLLEPLRAEGYPTGIIPGVTSFSAVAARLGVGLTEMDRPLHIIPAAAMDTREALELPGSKVLMKPCGQVPQVAEALAERGLLERARLVSNCGLEGEVVCEDLTHLPEDLSYYTTIVVKE